MGREVIRHNADLLNPPGALDQIGYEREELHAGCSGARTVREMYNRWLLDESSVPIPRMPRRFIAVSKNSAQ